MLNSGFGVGCPIILPVGADRLRRLGRLETRQTDFNSAKQMCLSYV